MAAQTPEDQLRAIITVFLDNAIAGIAKQAERSQSDIRDYITHYLASLSIDVPISLKAVLDKGGQVRQIMLYEQEHQPGGWIANLPVPNGMEAIVIEVGPQYGPPVRKSEVVVIPAAKHIRITVIVEPA